VVEDLDRPRDGVACADSRRLRPGPEPEVLWAVIVPNSVSVVDGFIFLKVAAEHPLCHEDVLEHVRRALRPRMPRAPHRARRA
jgi:hypothetical protein